MNSGGFFPLRRLSTVLILAGLIAVRAQAEPTIDSVDPSDGASGVSTTTTVVFTFSETMDTDTNVTTATFFDISNPFFPLPTSNSWSVGNTVMTCTPLPSFPANKTIFWSVDGQNLMGEAVEGTTFGSFATDAGGTGSGTNAFTTFSIGKVHHYQQASTALPTLDPTTPYGLSAATFLSSNRTATNINLTFPSATVSNLTQFPPPQAEIYVFFGYETSLSTFDTKYPAGNYSFQVRSVSSNQSVIVTLPPTNTLPQPGAPHVSNFAAAQTVDPSQPFVLSWDAYPGGTSADYIDVDIGASFGSPEPGTPGALSGTNVNFTIPAGTLQTNTTYASQIGFFHRVGATNGGIATNAYRATYTKFTLITIGSSGSLVLTNLVFANAPVATTNFSFDVLCSPGQNVIVEYKTNLATGVWQTLLTTNSSGSSFHVISPATNVSRFFRARSGS